MFPRALLLTVALSACELVPFVPRADSGDGEGGGGGVVGAGGGSGGGTGDTGGGLAGGGPPDAGCSPDSRLCDGECVKLADCCTSADCPAQKTCEEMASCSAAHVCLYSASPIGTACGSDGNPCTEDICNGGGGCVHVANDAGCEDGVACTLGDRCRLGACEGGPSGCVLAGECFRVTMCLSDGGCGQVPKDAGTACTPDGLPCTVDVCNGAGGCTHAPLGAGAACPDDGNICTSDLCAADGGCQHAPRAGACNDNNPCTQGDMCNGGACGGSPTNCNDMDPCTTDSCAPDAGCRHPPAPDGTPCTDELACTADRCSLGACLSTTTCYGGGPCQANGCYCPSPEQYCAGRGCLSVSEACKDLSCGFCGRSGFCDGIAMQAPDPPGTQPTDAICSHTLALCSAANTGGMYYYFDLPRTCRKWNGVYQWAVWHNSLSTGGAGCQRGAAFCSYSCGADAPPYFCNTQNNWDYDLSPMHVGSVGCDGTGLGDLVPLPAGWMCP